MVCRVSHRAARGLDDAPENPKSGRHVSVAELTLSASDCRERSRDLSDDYVGSVRALIPRYTFHQHRSSGTALTHANPAMIESCMQRELHEVTS
jgi:hypothetical protein